MANGGRPSGRMANRERIEGGGRTMRVVTEFVKTTVIGGLLFLVPIVVGIFIVQRALGLARRVLGPVVERLPFNSVAGVAVASLAAGLLVVVTCFIGGLVARTRIGRRLQEGVKRIVLGVVPGYRAFESIASRAAGQATEFEVVLARIEDAWQLAFLIERMDGGLSAVFIPAAPTPWSGSVFYLTADRIRPVDVPMAQAIRCIKRLGTGSRELLQGQMPPG
jgi:uncharacterized membrane protein